MFFREALEGYRNQFGPEHVNPAIVELNLARLLLRGRSAESESRFAHALPIVLAAFPGNRVNLGDLINLGLLQCQGGRSDDAVGNLRKAIEGLRPADGSRADDD